MSNVADRVRAYRKRRNDGLVCITIEIPEVELAEGLYGCCFLKRSEIDDREAIRAATERFVRMLCT
ncbi:MAG: hypothetical protein GEU95_10565 [Rhizobiales bacterium]|nr:hypothetical protein [Hyphomicrobiales bacterium]